MTDEDFEVVVRARLEAIASVLLDKGLEYGSQDDRLHNFVTAGRIDNETPERALWGMWKKHIVSIRDMIDKLERNPHYVPSEEYLAEKLGDNINYTLLLEGLIEDRRARQ